MIFNLLSKELRIAAHPNLYIFTLFGPLVLIPAYPYTMVFLFSCIGNFINLMYARETNDIYFTALLPIKKEDVVKSKLAALLFSQIVTILFSLPFAIVRMTLLTYNNPVGVEANVAFYGFGLLIFAVFNSLFLPIFFKTAYKAGIAFLIALVPTTLIALVAEGMVYVPQLQWLDSTLINDQIQQLPILLVGFILYGLSIVIAYKISVKRFLKVDL